ncbi:MAG TPA: ribosome small subunit-dependent GTPase A [Acidimicrobiales bacterium]
MPDPHAALVPLGWDERVATLFASHEAPGVVPGRVGRVERSASFVHLADGGVLAEGEELPAVGDWVAVRAAEGGTFLVEAILPRSSALSRQDPGAQTEQVLAANIDVVAIVAPLDRLKVARVERELLVAWESGARPLVVLTKGDVVDDPDRARADLADRLVGSDVVVTSAKTGAGVDLVREALQPNRTAVLFGPSGAGKSTLANALLGEEVLATGEVREGDSRGRHTTTSRHLFTIPGGGVLIDTPGIRSITIWRGEEGLASAFADVEAATAACRFRDCAHDREPGCGITAAVERGELDPERVANYRKLLREVEFAERQHDLQFQQERKEKWKAIHKAARQFPKKR